MANEDLKERIISIAEKRGEFVTDVDGFVYYWPDGSPHGHLSSATLRILADELDERNKEWQANIDKYFNEQENIK